MQSEIPVDGKIIKDLMIPMRDGTHLAADVYIPNDAPASGLPALLAMSAYGKNIQRQMPVQPMPSVLGDACIEAGWTQDFLDRGYIHVIADSRGIGTSEGEYLSMYSKQESEDGYDLVEWIAKQDWCNGDVGMVGISYYGTIQLVVASSLPPSLKAIAPIEATTDQYLACYHGGVVDGFYSELYTGRHSTLGWSGFQGANLRPKSFDFWNEDELKARVEELKRSDAAQYNLLYSILDQSYKNPIMFDILVNEWDDDGDYWWNPDISKIDIPVICGVAWYPDCGPKFVRGPFQIWDAVKGPKKMLLHKAGWLDRPYHQFHSEILDFFDHHIKGIENGVMDGPPIQLHVNGTEETRGESEWPLARTEWTPFYLQPHHGLSTRQPRGADLAPDAYAQAPLLVTDKVASMSYSTGPLPGPVEITGPVVLNLQAALDAEDGWFKATLIDRDSRTGAEKEVTHGHLRASHRALDPDRSKPYLPIHSHRRETVEPVAPGEITDYSIELYPMSHVFLSGHELVLRIASADLPGHQFSYHVVPAETITYKIFRDADHPSHLLLPVIPSSAE